jgi:hypothetical protein
MDLVAASMSRDRVRIRNWSIDLPGKHASPGIVASRIIAALFPLALSGIACAHASPDDVVPPVSPARRAQKLPDDLVRFFSGEWSGAGEFADGRKIEADVSFRQDLGGQWLSYRHADRPPGKYEAAGMWGHSRPSNAFVMTLNDSAGGSREFSSDGWHDGRIVFDYTVPLTAGAADGPAQRQRFTFAREGDDRMRMSFKTATGDQPWHLVDYLVFSRNPPPDDKGAVGP